MARRAVGSLMRKATTPAKAALSGGTMATPKPAATKPGTLLESSPSKLIAGLKPAAAQRSSVKRRKAWPGLNYTKSSPATSRKATLLRLARRWPAGTIKAKS